LAFAPSNNDFGKIAVTPPAVLVGDVTLDTLEQVLITSPLTATRFTAVNGRDGVYRLDINGDIKTVTFGGMAANDASGDGGLHEPAQRQGSWTG
jgi:hypothetical protein